MVYIFGAFGFVIGFSVGLGVINVLLRNRSINEVKDHKSSKRVYGLAVWGLAAIGCWLGIGVYNNYFY
jgi:hypothetical protein